MIAKCDIKLGLRWKDLPGWSKKLCLHSQNEGRTAQKRKQIFFFGCEQHWKFVGCFSSGVRSESELNWSLNVQLGGLRKATRIIFVTFACITAACCCEKQKTKQLDVLQIKIGLSCPKLTKGTVLMLMFCGSSGTGSVYSHKCNHVISWLFGEQQFNSL